MGGDVSSTVRQEIVVGFRDREGHLTSTETLKTADIPRMVRTSSGQWNPQTCQDWALRALLHMTDVLSQKAYGGSPADVWRATFDPKAGLNLRKLEPREVEISVRCGEDRIGFLPRDYWEATST
jgi:RAT1-interacting protein